jgi:hypothetical protein
MGDDWWAECLLCPWVATSNRYFARSNRSTDDTMSASIGNPPGNGTSVRSRSGVPQFRQVELKNASLLRAKGSSILAFLSSRPWN